MLMLFVLIFIQIAGLSGYVKKVNNVLVEEVRTQEETISLIKQSIVSMSMDNNEIRSYMDLPPKNYPIFNRVSPVSGKQNNQDKQVLGFYRGIDLLVDNYAIEKNKARIKSFYTCPEFQAFIKTNKLSIDKTDPLSVLIVRNKNIFFSIALSPGDDNFVVNSFLNETVKDRKYSAKIEKFMEKNLEKLNAHYKNIYDRYVDFKSTVVNKKISSRIKDLNIHFSRIKESYETYSLSLQRFHFNLKTFNLNKLTGSFIVEDKVYDSYEKFTTALSRLIPNIDIRTPEEVSADKAKERIDKIISDSAFKALLSGKKLHIAGIRREDNDNFYYDILNKKNELLGAFAVLKYSGEIYITDREDVQICSLESILSRNEVEKKN